MFGLSICVHMYQEVAADTVPEAEGEGSEEESDMVVQ